MSRIRYLLQPAKNIFCSIRAISTSNVTVQRSYTPEEKNYILIKIQEKDFPRKAVSETQLKNITEFMAKQPLKSLEDLLQISGIGPKMLRKICEHILDAKNGIVREPPKKSKLKSNLIVPGLSYEQRNKLIKIVSIHINPEMISWSLLDSAKKVLDDWDYKEFREENANIFHFLRFTHEIYSSLPDGDFYVFQSPHSVRQLGDPVSNMTLMLLSFLYNARNIKSDVPITGLLNSRALCKFYHGLVGSELVSLQPVVEDILDQRSTLCSVYVSETLKDKYRNCDSLHKECLSQALLLATAFVDIVINNRIEGLIKH